MSARERSPLSRAIDRLALLLGLANIGPWTYMTFHGGNECQYFFDNPILLFAFLLFITWLLKFISYKYLCCSSTRIQRVSATVMLALVLAIFSSLIFALIVTNKNNDEVIPGYKKSGEYGRFKPTAWFPKYVLRSMHRHGDRPAKCVSGVCQAFAGLNLSASEFEKIERRLSPLESGCCVPPTYCCKKYKNATFWEEAQFCPFGYRERGMFVDCRNWKSGHTTLCYSCGNCLVRIIATALKVWRHLSLFNINILVLTIILYCYDSRFWRKKYNVPIKSGSELSPN